MLYPKDCEKYLTQKARVEAIARLKYKTAINQILRVPMIQDFLREQGVQNTSSSAIMRSQMEENHWAALAECLQKRAVGDQILETLNNGS